MDKVSASNIFGRLSTSILTTGSRHVLALLTGILVARSLAPEQFGNLMFLLTTFAAVNGVIDLYANQAFYTFVSRRPRSTKFYLYYGVWIVLQLVVPVVVIFLIFPDSWLVKVWRGQESFIILLAILASYAQKVLWQMVMQIGESRRLTLRVQFASLGIAVIHLILVAFLFVIDRLSVEILLALIAAEFGLMSIAILISYQRSETSGVAAPVPDENFRQVFGEFALYVYPLIPLALFQFATTFGDTWLLQFFGGPVQQAFYNIAIQYANIGVIFGMATSHVFWKELAAAFERGDIAGMGRIYRKGIRVLFSMSAVVAGFLVFWTDPIIIILLGQDFAGAGPVFILTLISSLFVTSGVVISVTFLATGRTKVWSLINITYVIFSLPATALILGAFNLGALGLGAKLLVFTAVQMLISDAINNHKFGWRNNYLYLIAVTVVSFAAGWVAFQVATWVIPSASDILRIVGAGLVYAGLLTAPAYFFAKYTGLDWFNLKKFVFPTSSA